MARVTESLCDVNYGRDLFDSKFDTRGRSVVPINNPKTVRGLPPVMCVSPADGGMIDASWGISGSGAKPGKQGSITAWALDGRGGGWEVGWDAVKSDGSASAIS